MPVFFTCTLFMIYSICLSCIAAFNVSCDVTTKRPGLVQSYEELVRDYVVSAPHIIVYYAHTYVHAVCTLVFGGGGGNFC